jgi:2,6-dihydroxypyridine 3-monooxygenase
MADVLRVVIVGGSIGGLTAGLLLHDLGLDVEIFERSGEALRSRGAGIVVLPMAEKYLVKEAAADDRVSLQLTWWKYVDGEGRVLAADADKFRFSAWSAVYGALLRRFPRDRYHLNSEMVGFDHGSQSVAAGFADGTSVAADLLVCADGLASTARRILMPEVEPTYAGYVAWRGTAHEANLSAAAIEQLADSMLYQILDLGHVLVYAIPGADGSTEPGARRQNFVWYHNYDPGQDFEEVMTDRAGVRRSLSVPPGLVRTEPWSGMCALAAQLAPAIREVVLESPEPFVQAVFDLESPRMAFGRVCTIGDAAFSARPHVAAGTAKAAADAWALRDALGAKVDLSSALAQWERRQLRLGRSVVARSRAMGRRSQIEGTMVPGDPAWKFGLIEAGN